MRGYLQRLSPVLVAGAVVLAMASVSFAASSETVKGIVSNSKCGAKDASADGAACSKKCIKEGATAVIVTDTDQKVVMVDNPDTLKDHYGHHVAVTGKMDGDKMHIDNVAMMK